MTPLTPWVQVALPIRSHEGVWYSECSRIWNPIHTDVAAATASGLPAPIVHGTLTMAKCVSYIVKTYGFGDPHRVTRVRVGRFLAPVFMPSEVALRVKRVRRTHSHVSVSFEAVTQEGELAISDGVVLMKNDVRSKL